MGVGVVGGGNADAGGFIEKIHGQQAGGTHTEEMDAPAGTDLLHSLRQDGDVEHLVGERGVLEMNALGFSDNGLHIVIVTDGGLEIIQLSLSGLPGQVQFERGETLKAQPFGKTDHRRRGGGAGCGVFLGVHMDDLRGVVQQICG